MILRNKKRTQIAAMLSLGLTAAACAPVPTPASMPGCSGAPTIVMQGNVLQRIETCKDGRRIIIEPAPVPVYIPDPAPIATSPLPPTTSRKVLAASPAVADVAPVIETDAEYVPTLVDLNAPPPPLPDATAPDE